MLEPPKALSTNKDKVPNEGLSTRTSIRNNAVYAQRLDLARVNMVFGLGGFVGEDATDAEDEEDKSGDARLSTVSEVADQELSSEPSQTDDSADEPSHRSTPRGSKQPVNNDTALDQMRRSPSVSKAAKVFGEVSEGKSPDNKNPKTMKKRTGGTLQSSKTENRKTSSRLTDSSRTENFTQS